MELDDELLDRFLRWKRVALWILLALICGALVVASAIYFGSRSGSGGQEDSESTVVLELSCRDRRATSKFLREPELVPINDG
jgi:hypothetical protein